MLEFTLKFWLWCGHGWQWERRRETGYLRQAGPWSHVRRHSRCVGPHGTACVVCTAYILYNCTPGATVHVCYYIQGWSNHAIASHGCCKNPVSKILMVLYESFKILTFTEDLQWSNELCMYMCTFILDFIYFDKFNYTSLSLIFYTPLSSLPRTTTTCNL